MAYLNVRERRIETTIAYVGADPEGTSSNFERLRTSREGRAGAVEEKKTDGGAILSFDWWPHRLAKFDDCDVMVKLVTARGPFADRSVAEVLTGADAVVVVLDPDPEASARNKVSVETVRSVMSRDGKARPVIVQIDGGGDAGAVVEASGASGWPQVTASTATGTGIHETLERVLSEVIDTMKQSEPQMETSASVAPRATSPRTEGNPLLAALKQILQSTVSEHIDALEQRITARLEAQLDRVQEDLVALRRQVDAGIGSSATLPAGLESVPARIDAVATRLEAVEQSLKDKIEGVEQTLADMPTDVLSLREHAVDLRREIAGFEERSSAAADSRSRADREHATAAASVLRRAIEAVASDLRESKVDIKEIRKSDARESTKDIASRLESVSSATEDMRGFVEPAAASVRAIPARIDELESKVQKQIRDELARRFKAVDDAFSILHTDTSGALARVDARSAAIEANLTEFITELKQRKKGWFG